jgi:transcriptional regulator with XRE-family HTH domain
MNKAIGMRLRELRGGRSVSEFSVVLGVHPNTLRNYENGKTPNLDVLIQACTQLGCSPEWLIFGSQTSEANLGQPEAPGPRANPDESFLRAEMPLLLEISEAARRHFGERMSGLNQNRFKEIVLKTYYSLHACGVSGEQIPSRETTQSAVKQTERIVMELE